MDIYGLEGGFAFRPTEGLTLSATAAWLDTEVKEIRADDATNLPGDSPDYVPELSYSVSGVYEFDWAAGLPGFVRLDYSYRDEVSYVDRSSFDVVPQFADTIGLLGARAGVQVSDNLAIEIFGSNLTNENEWLDPYHEWRNANRAKPRMVGVKITYESEAR